MDITADLDEAIRLAGVPITGVSVGTIDNRATWKVRPNSLQAQAQPVIDAFVIPTPNTMFDKFAELRINEKAIKSWAKALWEAIPAPVTDWNATKARAKDVFKNNGNGS